MDEYDRARLPYAPILAPLEELARYHGMTLTFDTHDGSVCELGWTNSRGHICHLFIDWTYENDFSIHAMHWGTDRLLGRRHWPELVADADVAEKLKVILADAKRWADEEPSH